jgi:hypothetical protein
MRARALGSAAALLVAAGVGIAAVVNAVTGGGGSAPQPAASVAAADRLEGPDVPVPGVLPGRLVLAESDGCRLRLLDLPTLTLSDPGPSTACRLWVSPRGDLAAVAIRRPRGTLSLVRLDERPVLDARLGEATSAPSWAPDGGRIAWCVEDSTTVLDVYEGGTESLPGCYPAYAPDGSLVTRAVTDTGLRLFRDGEPIDSPATQEEPGRRVVGHNVLPDGQLVVAIHRRYAEGPSYEAVLEVWRGAELTRTVPIHSYGVVAQAFGLRVVPSPAGFEAAVVSPESPIAPRPDALVSLVDFRVGGPLEGVTERPFGGISWSPDGGWLALSTGREILVFGRGRSEPAYVLPVAARSLAWR